MADEKNDDSQWVERERPATLSKRFFFEGYSATSSFLDKLANLSEETGIFPDISFGRDYANVSIHPGEGETLSETERGFSLRIDALTQDGN